ncbi:MAG: NAD(P)/FAD-dependent oxidoreductase [Geminicoccaceae bacterium]|nr:MAG: NAD(P)/FAD-dependent oxidoreductase [Geminicoccaceae bacterium]
MDGLTITDASRSRLEALRLRVQSDLGYIDHPAATWRPNGDDGVLDVLIVGAGQSGLATAFQLMRDKVTNLLVVDRAEAGREGPWRTIARMRTLRSPKEFTGPDLGVPSLTYRAYHEARFGPAAWQQLGLVPKEHWADYLDWYRETLQLPVVNGWELISLRLVEGVVEATLRDAAGTERVRRCRRVVLATGLEGLGRWWMPESVAALPAHLRSHTADDIDFARLAGKTVGVLGAGASAADNAATALEAGAKGVKLFCRRLELQRVQPYRWLTFTGFLRHLGDLDDAWRWRFMHHVMGLREGFPPDTYQRCLAHPGFDIVTGAPWDDVRAIDDRIEVTTPIGRFTFDHVIAGTGIDVDFTARPELRAHADHIATWDDRYTPEPQLRDARLARYPYLGPDFTLQEKTPGSCPLLARIHVFNFGATMSFGPSGSSINAMTTAVPKLAAGITRGLFTAELEQYWQGLAAYDAKLFELQRKA